MNAKQEKKEGLKEPYKDEPDEGHRGREQEGKGIMLVPRSITRPSIKRQRAISY